MSQNDQTPPDRYAAGGRGTDGALSDRFFLQIVCGILAAVVIGFLISTIAWGTRFPSTLATLFFGVLVGVLIYVFVDPEQENKVAVGAVSLGGMAAVVAAFALLFADDINAEMNGGPTQNETQTELAQMKKQLATADKTNAELNERLRKLLEDELGGGRTLDQSEYFALITADQPNGALNAAIIQAYETRRGPFDATLETIRPVVAFDERVEEGTFEYCENHDPDLNVPLELDRVIDGRASGKLLLKPADPIGPACGEASFGAVIKLGCDAARVFLSATEAEGCTRTRGVLWTPEVPIDKRRFQLVGSTINPKFVD
jgi:hypothetical protein